MLNKNQAFLFFLIGVIGSNFQCKGRLFKNDRQQINGEMPYANKKG